jgi:hypothetical protein
MYFEERFVGHSKLETIRAIYASDNQDFCDHAKDAMSVAVQFCSEPEAGSVLYVSASGHCASTEERMQTISIVTWFDKPRP